MSYLSIYVYNVGLHYYLGKTVYIARSTVVSKI